MFLLPPSRFSRATATLVVVALSMGAVSACALNGGPLSSVTTTMDAGVGRSSIQAGIEPLGEADREMKTLRPEEPAQLLVKDVRIGSHGSFDRVVFDLVGTGDPGWFIDYTDNPSQQGSGQPIPHLGDAALNVNIDGTVYPFELGEEDPQLGTVTGTGNVLEVRSAGTVEGRSQFIISLNTAVPYSVQLLEDPKRLVIDLIR